MELVLRIKLYNQLIRSSSGGLTGVISSTVSLAGSPAGLKLEAVPHQGIYREIGQCLVGLSPMVSSI